MKRWMWLLAVGLVALPLAGATKARKPLAEDRAAVEAAMQRYAESLRNGTPEEVAAHYAADGELLLPG